MRAFAKAFTSFLLASSLITLAAAQNRASIPYPNAHTAKAIDLGKPDSATRISVTLTLRLNNANGAEQLLTELYTPGNSQFHRFLTAEQFTARFAPTQVEVARTITALEKYGLTAERSSATTLKVSGLPADLERAFAVSLHSYAVPAQQGIEGYTFRAPLSHPTIPAEISSTVSAAVGFDTSPHFRPYYHSAPQAIGTPKSKTPPSTPDPPGLWTVTDFVDYYDVQPLYKAKASGKGHTVGIMTLASFTPSDAFLYWSDLGLTVDPNRLTVVNVDGGPGKPSDRSGSDETTLDVEQSGGIAPGANVVVYQAPNTNQGFVDVFASAIDANLADTLSISWGDWEWFSNLENAPVTDPITGATVGTTQAIHELLLRAAIQGQSVYAAAGDNGAYDADGSCPPGECSDPLAVDYPASDSLITASGGTTIPGVQEFCLDSACDQVYDVNIPVESVWGWDYLDGLCAALGLDPVSCGIFPGGTGGGVSVAFTRPLYQLILPGAQLSQPNQSFTDNGQILFALPPYFPGRNVPDISFNADPETGYVILYTSNRHGLELETFIGGTSFVGPQLNGVTALVDDYLHIKRMGLLNYTIYGLALVGDAYRGPRAPMNIISAGDNWFYHGRNGYSPAVGLGTLDVANFASRLKGSFIF